MWTKHCNRYTANLIEFFFCGSIGIIMLILLNLSNSFKDLDVLTTSCVFGGMLELDGHWLCPRFKMVSFYGYPRIQHFYHVILPS